MTATIRVVLNYYSGSPVSSLHVWLLVGADSARQRVTRQLISTAMSGLIMSFQRQDEEVGQSERTCVLRRRCLPDEERRMEWCLSATSSLFLLL